MTRYDALFKYEHAMQGGIFYSAGSIIIMSKKYEDRETIEWVNSWLAHADCEGDRILLIGDSVTRELRGKLEHYISHWYNVDLFAASFAITDHLFWRNLECFFNGDYKYKIIIINYGFHHGFSVKCTSGEEVYRTMYQKLIDICRQLCNRVIVMTGTSCMRSDHLDQIETVLEEEIIARNNALKKAAEHTGCDLFDLYDIIKHGTGTDFKYIDTVHFEKKAYFYIAYEMLALLELVEESERKKVQENVCRALGIQNEKSVIIYGGVYRKRSLFLVEIFLSGYSGCRMGGNRQQQCRKRDVWNSGVRDR